MKDNDAAVETGTASAPAGVDAARVQAVSAAPDTHPDSADARLKKVLLLFNTYRRSAAERYIDNDDTWAAKIAAMLWAVDQHTSGGSLNAMDALKMFLSPEELNLVHLHLNALNHQSPATNQWVRDYLKRQGWKEYFGV